MTGRLHDKVAMITGAGSGFGRGAARLFAREGARVVATDIDADAAADTVEQIRRDGGEATSLRVDVSQPTQLEEGVSAAAEAYGRLDVMFNNAGVPMPPTAAEDVTDDLYRRVAEVNMHGAFAGCRAAIPVMKRQGGGVIINTASTGAIRPRPRLSVYNASKGFVVVLTKALAVELAPHGIRVNAICPVAGDTPMLRTFLGEDEERAREAFRQTIPLGRLSTPEDIGWAAVYLASDQAGMITGTILEVDGGRDI